MSDKEQITPEVHKFQIEAYTAERPHYVTYADVLKRVLERACAVALPEAFVQARAKTVSSFAEKVARRWDTYRYPDRVMTDLCGVRVIVQTLEQVTEVRQFIEANFTILEADEKGLRLGTDKFGYRDMHYIVHLKKERCGALGIDDKEVKEIGDRKAEVQVRTWLQHAWADTLHDRLYKNPLPLPADTRRTGNLLAALMEEGDRSYNAMAHEIDGMLANYTSFAKKQAVKDEIQVQELILANAPDPSKRPALALKLARLHAACGDFAAVVSALETHAGIADANRCELLQDLGFALCKVHRGRPDSAEYQRGRSLLNNAIAACCTGGCAYVPNIRKGESLHARALWRLAWAQEPMRRERYEARELYHRALEHEPDNPYYLADMIGFEIYCDHQQSLPAAMRTVLLKAIRTCRDQAAAGIELPRAYFTAGRLGLLLGSPLEALGDYARGVRHCLAGTHCTPTDALAIEAEWVERLYVGKEAPNGHRWIQEFIDLAVRSGTGLEGTVIPPRALILSGGAASLDAAAVARIHPLIEATLDGFAGAVVSGGTTSGVPGCAGAAAAALTARGAKGFELVGYIPEQLPHDAEKDKRYDRMVVYGKAGFSPDQILQSWRDLLDAGVKPQEVMCIGFGGGSLSAVEYRIALALGARVVATFGSGGTADALIADPLWTGVPNLMPLPLDQASFHALLKPGDGELDPDVVEAMAQELHKRYVKGSAKRLPANMWPWDQLEETYKTANLEQARYSVRILKSCGFKVLPPADPAHLVVFDAKQFSEDELARMAEMEHGRWNVERIRDGWRPGKPRDDEKKIHDNLLPWEDSGLDTVRHYDVGAVCKFPEILAKAGLEVRRP